MPLLITSASITPEMRERINRFWSRIPRPCAVCGNLSWSVEESLAQLNILQTLPHMAPPIFPLVVITCQTCGNTILLNALKLGWDTNQLGVGQ